MQHWEEEVVLIQEEMCRVIAYHEWKAQWWLSQTAHRSDTDDAKLHGVAAYAEKQAYLSDQLAWQCAKHWLPALKERGISTEWEERFPLPPVVTPVQCAISFAVDNDHNKDDEGLEVEVEGFEGLEEIDGEEREPEEYDVNSDSDDNMAFLELDD